MNQYLCKLKELPLNLFVLCAFITAPLYYIRQYGFDFSKGSSLSLVDGFIFIVLIKACWVLLKRFRETKCSTQECKCTLKERLLKTVGPEVVPFFVLAAVFCVWGVASAPLGRMFIDVSHPIVWPQLLSTVIQYGFLMAAFPLIASVFLREPAQRMWALRATALGYFIPLLINLALLPEGSCPYLREMFFSVRRAIGTYGNANSFAYVVLIVLPLYVYLAAIEKNTFWRRLGWVGLSCSLIGLLLGGSFGSWIALSLMALISLAALLLWKNHPVQNKKKAFGFVGKSVGLTLILACGLIVYSPPVVKDVVWRVGPIFEIKETQVDIFAEEIKDQWFDALGMLSILSEAEVIAAKKKAANWIHAYEARIKERALLAPDLQHRETWEKMGSSSQRISMMKGAAKLIVERWGGLFFGHGLRQTFAFKQFHFGGNPLDVHVVYLLLWIEGGFVMTALFLGFMFLMSRQVWLFAKQNPAMAVAYGSSILAVLLICGINPHLYLRYYWVPLLPVFSMYSGIKQDNKA